MSITTDQGLRARHLLLIYVAISAILGFGVFQRWQAAAHIGDAGNVQHFAPSLAEHIAQPSAVEQSAATELQAAPTNTAGSHELIALRDSLLDERDRLARHIALNEQAQMAQIDAHLAWFNALPQEQRTPEISAAFPMLAFGMKPLYESFQEHPDDWHFTEEQAFFDAFYQQIEASANHLDDYLQHFACTSSHCELQFTSLPEPLYQRLQGEFQALSGERMRHHPHIAMTIGSSPSTNTIRFNIGRK